jgi:hypothetical protein
MLVFYTCLENRDWGLGIGDWEKDIFKASLLVVS